MDFHMGSYVNTTPRELGRAKKKDKFEVLDKYTKITAKGTIKRGTTSIEFAKEHESEVKKEVARTEAKAFFRGIKKPMSSFYRFFEEAERLNQEKKLSRKKTASLGPGKTNVTAKFTGLKIVENQKDYSIDWEGKVEVAFTLFNGAKHEVDLIAFIISRGKDKSNTISSLIKYIRVKVAVRVFGIFAALADGMTQYYKGQKAYRDNNDEAGVTYMVSGVLLGFGGLLLLSSMPVALFLGAVLLVEGMMTLFKAEGLEWDNIDKWLDASLFGKYNIPKNIIYWQKNVLNPLYLEKSSQVDKEKNHQKEYNDFIRFFFIPKFDITWRGTAYLSNIDDRVITIKIRFPGALKKNFYWGWKFTRFNSKPQLTKTVGEKGKVLLAPYSSKINEEGEFELRFEEVRYNFKNAVFGVSWQLPFSNGSYTIVSYYSISEEDEEAVLLSKEISQ